jgi:hypothetical protein
MEPVQHPLCNDILRRPENMTEEECRDLPIFRSDEYVWSFWEPSLEELIALNRGGTIALAIQGTTHPPLSVQATCPHREQPKRETDPSEYRHKMQVLNERLSALVAITKRALSAWTGNRDDQRSGIVDEFLDFLTVNRQDGGTVRQLYRNDVPPGIDAAALRASIEAIRENHPQWVHDFADEILALPEFKI